MQNTHKITTILNIRLHRLLFMSDIIQLLEEMRASSGDAVTIGLPNNVILDFAKRDSNIVMAIEEGHSKQSEFNSEHLMMHETELISHLQEDFVNFYSPAT